MTIRVLLADDQELVRSGLAMILSLEEDIEVVGQVANGVQALEAVRSLKPQLVLMDVQMPVLDGISATAQITAHYPATSVLILTTFDREDYLFAALEAGASGFLLKTTEAEKLVEAVRQVAGGLALLSPEMTLPLIARWVESQQNPAASRPAGGAGEKVTDGANRQLAAQDALALSLLTRRERQTLELLARGLTNAEIAAQLFVGPATVKTYVSNVLAKTHSRDRVGAVIFAHRVGLLNP